MNEVLNRNIVIQMIENPLTNKTKNAKLIQFLKKHENKIKL